MGEEKDGVGSPLAMNGIFYVVHREVLEQSTHFMSSAG
jgi:hypothetical protein